MAIERRVTEIAGRVGGKLHTARSRNDQVATDVAMFVRAHAHAARRRGSATLAATLVDAGRGAPRLADARLHAPPARAAGVPEPPPARVRAGCWCAIASGSRACCAATGALPLGAGALAGVNFDTDRELVARELGFAEVRRELDRRRLEPRLRARLPRGRGHVRDPPVAPRRRDRAVVERGVRLLRGVRRVGLGLLDHAPEEEPRRRRAAAREGAAGGRPPGRAARRAPRAAADLQQGHAGGQGAPVRRRRHARAVPRRPRDGMLGSITFQPRAPRRGGRGRDARRHRRRRPARAPRDAVPRGPRRRRRPRADSAIEQGKRAVRADAARSSPRSRRCSTTSSTRCSADGAWLEAKVSEGGTSLRARARAARAGARGRRSDEARRSTTRPVLEVARDLIGCVVVARRLRRRDRRDRGLPRLRARLPRVRRPDAAHARRCSARRAWRTCTARTASTRC